MHNICNFAVNNKFFLSHSKKDAETRAEDLQKFAVPFLLESIAQNTRLWVQNNSNILILLEALKIGSGK